MSAILVAVKAFVLVHWTDEPGFSEIRGVYSEREEAERVLDTHRITKMRFRGDHDSECCEVREFDMDALPTGQDI